MKASAEACPICFWLWMTLSFLIGDGVLLAGPPPDQSDAFYDPLIVQTIHLEIDAEDLRRMQGALPQRISVPGTFRWNDQKFERVSIRYKGNSSSTPNSPHKRSFLIDFNEFKRDQKFLGLRIVALDNGIQFGSLFSERLITDALRDLGVKASRCNYARVFLNQTNTGVYVNVERIDESFLQRHFPAHKGLLFKVDEGGPGADLRYLGSDPSLYQKTFELHSGDKAQAYSRLIEFVRTINAPAVTETELSRVLDMDSFLKTTAVMLLAGAFDQYTGWGPHNYYLYQDPLEGGWTYLPWDLDVAFADNAFDLVPVLSSWHAAWPAPVPGRPLMEHLVSKTNLLHRYRHAALNILATYFKPEILIPKLRSLYSQIRTDLAQDPFPPRRATTPSDRSYDEIIASMEEFINKRYTLARHQLDAPGNRPAPVMLKPPEQEGPRPGPPSADAPSDLHTMEVMSGRVELSWTDRSEGEVAFVVQRCTGPGCTDFLNLIGQPSERGNIATDSQVRHGQTYRYRVYAVMPAPEGPRGTGISNTIEVRIPEKGF